MSSHSNSFITVSLNIMVLNYSFFATNLFSPTSWVDSASIIKQEAIDSLVDVNAKLTFRGISQGNSVNVSSKSLYGILCSQF